jgi:tRNA(Ile)-lysidine synthase
MLTRSSAVSKSAGRPGIADVRGLVRDIVRANTPEQGVVVAVSGGMDSMTLATILADTLPERVRAIAAFDHGTGPAATRAVLHVEAFARQRGFVFRSEQARLSRASEAAWRHVRWGFLHRVSAEFGAPVVTAHTADDQAETVFMRILRGAGTRGLAGLLAPSAICRPMLSVRRAIVRRAAVDGQINWIDDPSNADVRFLRNRVRHELLPTLERVEPGFTDWLLRLGERAAAWRAAVSMAADVAWRTSARTGQATVERDSSRRLSAAEAALFWPEIAGRAGVALDWRGTDRLASFTISATTGKSIPLSGGVRVRCEREQFVLERAEP